MLILPPGTLPAPELSNHSGTRIGVEVEFRGEHERLGKKSTFPQAATSACSIRNVLVFGTSP